MTHIAPLQEIKITNNIKFVFLDEKKYILLGFVSIIPFIFVKKDNDFAYAYYSIPSPLGVWYWLLINTVYIFLVVAIGYNMTKGNNVFVMLTEIIVVTVFFFLMTKMNPVNYKYYKSLEIETIRSFLHLREADAKDHGGGSP